MGAKMNLNRPDIVVPTDIQVPLPLLRSLPNGIRLYSLDCSEQDVIRVSFVFKGGTVFQDKAFSASATANMLGEGTENMTSQQIAETLDFYGSFYDVSLDRDYVVLTVASLTKFFKPTMEVIEDILLSPSFPAHELETYCSKRKHRLAVERSKVGFKARELFVRTLFGPEHPYGISYPEDCYDELTRDDVTSFYKKHYVAENCIIVCSGKVKEQETEIIANLASKITSGKEQDDPSFNGCDTKPFAFQAHRGAAQSAIRVGRILFPRTHSDFIPMQVVTSALGGYFGSRLVQNLREERGYTYGIFAGMVNLQQAGYMAIATEVNSSVTADAIKQIYYEVERMREELLPEHELDMVKNIMTGEVMRILDGPFGIADVTIENIENGTDNNHLHYFLEQVRAVTPEMVREKARKYLDLSSFTTVVVGDPEIEKEVMNVVNQK